MAVSRFRPLEPVITTRGALLIIVLAFALISCNFRSFGFEVAIAPNQLDRVLTAVRCTVRPPVLDSYHQFGTNGSKHIADQPDVVVNAQPQGRVGRSAQHGMGLISLRRCLRDDVCHQSTLGTGAAPCLHSFWWFPKLFFALQHVRRQGRGVE